MNNQKGQVILILILVMTVALAIGLSVIQRSLSDVSTATKLEQSSRAFSAAEAGIEKAIQQNSSISRITLDNSAIIEGVDKNDIPASGQALEYLPLAKEEMAQVWLANTETLNAVYTLSSFNLYFGTPNTTDKPAIEVTIVSWDGLKYVYNKRFFDSDSTRVANNGFETATCSHNHTVRTNDNTTDSRFDCQVSIDGYPYLGSARPILARIRFLYTTTSQPFALGPVSPGFLPVQAKIFTATGVSGQTQRKIQVFRVDKVVPPFFDYAIFSAGEINKE